MFIYRRKLVLAINVLKACAYCAYLQHSTGIAATTVFNIAKSMNFR